MNDPNLTIQITSIRTKQGKNFKERSKFQNHQPINYMTQEKNAEIIKGLKGFTIESIITVLNNRKGSKWLQIY